MALKLLKPKVLKQRPLLAELLCEEARFAAQLNHPNVVRVFDVTHTPKITYIVMEYIEGESLHQAIHRKGRLRPGEGAARGPRRDHGPEGARSSQGLIHRDIKPANILLAPTGLAKIVDLGLAQHSDDLSKNRFGDGQDDRGHAHVHGARSRRPAPKRWTSGPTSTRSGPPSTTR